MILEPAPVLTAALSGGRQACVLDARLVLSRLGLLAVARLQAELDVWMPAELRQVLRDSSTFRELPDRLVPRAIRAPERAVRPGEEEETIRDELALWHAWPVSSELSALRVHYLGDRADESHTPPGLASGLQERCEQLQEGLDRLQRASQFDRPRGETIAACFRDALALAAALQRQSAFILSRTEGEGGQPALLDYLAAWGVRAREVPRRGGRASLRVRNVIAHCGAAALSWCGVELAAVHVVLPGYPIAGGADPQLDPEQVARAWTSAEVHWYRAS